MANVRPIASNSDENGRAMNRRVDMVGFAGSAGVAAVLALLMRLLRM